MDKRWLGAAHEALDAFGVEASRVELIGVSENITFRAVEACSRQAYVLRLHRPGYHTAEEHDDLDLVPLFELIRGMALIGWKAERPEVEWPGERFGLLLQDVLGSCRHLVDGGLIGGAGAVL